jgi:hypothetical protein
MVSMRAHDDKAWLKITDLFQQRLRRSETRLDNMELVRSIVGFQELRRQISTPLVLAVFGLNGNEVSWLTTC